MDDRGRPVTVSGNLSTIKSRESQCSIQCPECAFKFYTYHIPGSCLKIICTECHAFFMGIVKTVDCGGCEERLKCLGLRSIPFECVDLHVRITPKNLVMPSGQYETILDAFQNSMKGKLGVTIPIKD